MDKEHDFQRYLEDEEFILRLAYLSDIFGDFIPFNLSFKGPNCTAIEIISKLGAFLWKLDLWLMNTESKRYGMSEHLTNHKSQTDDELAQK